MHYQTKGRILITRTCKQLDYIDGMEFLTDLLNYKHGAIYSSSFEYPGRYSRWDIGFCSPPLMFECSKLNFCISALNARGECLLPWIARTLQEQDYLANCSLTKQQFVANICLSDCIVAEEMRSQKPTVFSVLRSIINLFYNSQESHLGLYGAFGYDLVFQFEQFNQILARASDQRDLVLYLPDEIFVADHRKKQLLCYQYEFSYDNTTTEGLERSTVDTTYQPTETIDFESDHAPGEYQKVVNLAKEKFRRGDLFEVVPGQMFYDTYHEQPSKLFHRLKQANPAPYGFMINLGLGEFLIGASPEMYVRVKGNRVETCPISGTIKRGKDALEDAANVQTLLNSPKEEAELTMCTDVDRNDKSRICQPGSVQVIGRRQIEMYSRVIHTVDHVEGILRPEFDALDAFLTHMWVVTVTGAPKLWAMNFIEQYEKSPRRWYAGSIGWLGFDGNMNTGLTLRTVRLCQGVAEVRAGATLLYDSDPMAEEEEIRLKAMAFLEAIQARQHKVTIPPIVQTGKGKKILLIDHQDSFVHTLANYLRQTGAEVLTLRAGLFGPDFQGYKPDLIVLSPGPGCPEDFNIQETLNVCLRQKLPIFGVCLGLQAIAEYFGAYLRQLDKPVHGKISQVNWRKDSPLFSGLQAPLELGRYHSLYVDKRHLPEVLCCEAQTHEGIVMALSHQTLPLCAVQFHPESILSQKNQSGLKILTNAVAWLDQKAYP